MSLSRLGPAAALGVWWVLRWEHRWDISSTAAFGSSGLGTSFRHQPMRVMIAESEGLFGSLMHTTKLCTVGPAARRCRPHRRLVYGRLQTFADTALRHSPSTTFRMTAAQASELPLPLGALAEFDKLTFEIYAPSAKSAVRPCRSSSGR